MPDWLLNPAAANGEARTPLEDLTFQVGASVVAGFIVAAIFRATIVTRDRSASLPTTLVLLTVMTAIVTLVIGSNVARAFGLVGALSIVRFRTVVEDTRETAFVIFSVVVGMAVGANYILLALVAMVAVTVVASVMRWVVPTGRMQRSARLLLCVRLASTHDTAPMLEVFKKYTKDFKTVGVSSAKQGAAMELTYGLRMSGGPETMIPFFAELNKVDGVQGVEIKESAKS